ncbi:MAG: tRNA (adenosine(37)-N6)-threonylcarbamoyltransferase complex dimerization subunit type 1 TsaB [Solirubrobacterales bacterium]
MATTIGFDTATEETVVGATVDGESTFEFRSGPADGDRPAHSSELLPAIEQAVESVGGWTEVDRVVTGVGPGTYTGLRVALATAKGIALARTAEVVGVPTLEAMARSIHRAAAGNPEIAVPALDARRGELFFAAYDRSGREVHPASVGSPEDLVEAVSRLGLPSLVAGPGSLRFRSEVVAQGLEPAGVDDPENHLLGPAICELGDQEDRNRQGSLEPIYLRAPDAERWTRERREGD